MANDHEVTIISDQGVEQGVLEGNTLRVTSKAPELTDEHLETELHLLAMLLERHKNLITVLTDDGELSIGAMQDHSAELHKGLVIFLRAYNG